MFSYHLSLRSEVKSVNNMRCPQLVLTLPILVVFSQQELRTGLKHRIYHHKKQDQSETTKMNGCHCVYTREGSRRVIFGDHLDAAEQLN